MFVNKTNLLSVLAIFATAYLETLVNAETCASVGGLHTFSDPTCAQGGVGCNAGGQTNCRFCGTNPFPDCPTVTSPRPTTPKVTKITTKRQTPSKTTRDPNLPTGGPRPTQPAEEVEYNEHGERLIFSDDFDIFDLRRWKHDLTLSGGGNWEFQVYHNNRTNSFVKDGALHIHPTLTEDRIGEANLKNNFRMDMWGGGPADQCTGNNFYGCERTSGAGGNILNPIQSAKITTVDSFSFKYGRVEVRAKLPRGDWLWPAIWMLPRWNDYGNWPASGEIDIMEGRGNEVYNDVEGGLDSFGSTLHWGVDWSQNRYPLTHAVYKHDSFLSDDFHVYGLYWTSERLYTYIDDPENVVMDIDLTEQTFFERGEFAESYENPWQHTDNVNAPFDQQFYLIINLAVGGTGGYFKDGVSGKPWSDKSSSAVNDFYNAKNQWWKTWENPDRDFIIDSVKVWAIDE